MEVYEMEVKEIIIGDLCPATFISKKIDKIKESVRKGLAVNALSGGVDSSAVTVMGYIALGNRLKTYFIDTGLMREGEPQQVATYFEIMGIPIEIIDAQGRFFDALKGLTDPEEKREAITRTFYKDVFADLIRQSGARYLLQGTNYTDVEETVAGVKRQHNILEQLGINTEEQFGYRVIEPLVQLRKPAIREVAKALALPKAIYNRPPFPGPGLAIIVKGEVTPERVRIVRKATKIVEEVLSDTGAFQYLAILHEDKFTGVRQGKRDYGFQIEIRCWESADAKTGLPTRPSYDILDLLAEKIPTEVPGVVSVTYNITKKPPSTIEAE